MIFRLIFGSQQRDTSRNRLAVHELEIKSPTTCNQSQIVNESSQTIHWPVLWPILTIVAASIVIRLFDLDRSISKLNYDPVKQFWPFERSDPWLSFYRYGVIPPLLLGIAGGIAALFARLIWRTETSDIIRRHRAAGMFLVLMLAIGPGLMVNGILKSVWGRPRPLQCTEFGGELTFRQVGEWSAQKFPNSSFPSGHASIAYFLIAPCFLAGTQQITARRCWMVTGLGYGTAMGITRIMQGGHFLSDVIWAGLIVYLTGVVLDRAFRSRSFASELPVRSVDGSSTNLPQTDLAA